MPILYFVRAIFFTVIASALISATTTADDHLDTVYSDFLAASDTSPEFSVPSVTIIHAQAFPASAITAADVIEQAPGIQMQNSGAAGSYARISVRGAPSQQTQIYIDGILQSNAGGDAGYLQLISLADVERIEVYAGSLPGQFAQATPGGAINIVRKPGANKNISLMLDAGSFGHRRISALGSSQWQHWQLSGFVEAFRSTNDFSYRNDNGTPLVEEDDQTQKRHNAQYKSLQTSVKSRYRQQDLEAYAFVDVFNDTKHLPSWNNLATNRSYYQQQALSLNSGIGWNQWLDGLDTDLRWQSRQDKGHFKDPAGDISLSESNSYDKLISHQLQQHSVYSTTHGQIRLTNGWQRDQFSLRDDRNGQTLDARRVQLNSALNKEWFASQQLTIAATGRHQWYEDHQSDTEHHQQWGTQLGARLDVGQFSWQANVQRAVRIPSLIERFGNRGTFVGNESLAAEQAWAFDTTVGYQAADRELQASLFYRSAKNAIAPTYNSQGIGRYINLQKARYAGIEWQLSQQIRALQLSSSGALQDSIVDTRQQPYDGKQVPGYYPISTTQSIAWTVTPTVTSSLSYLYESGLYYDRNNSTQAPDKHQIDATLTWQYRPVTLTLEITNLLNNQFFDYDRRPLPGRAFVITLKYPNEEKEP